MTDNAPKTALTAAPETPGTTPSRRLRTALLTGIPAAVIGSMTVAVGATPAAAVEPAHTVPASPSVPASHTVQPGDSVWGIAQRYGLRTADVLAWNGLEWSSIIRPGDVLRLAPAVAAPAPPPAPAATAHTIVAGDTVWAIARAHGTTVDAVLTANGLDRGSIIYPGQTLLIPAAGAAASAPPVETSTAAPQKSVALDAEQIANARLIIQVGRDLRVPDRGIAIALAAAMVESWMRNLDWGDRDSLGLFQQRPSTGWGSEAEVRDPHRAARAFFGGPHDPNGHRTRGLLDIPGWQDLEFGAAAQAVQISAYPERYGQWEQAAWQWLAALG